MMNYGYNYNPMLNAQQRLAQYEPQQQNFMRVIPVTNIEEANATQVDVQGTPTFFYNQAKNEIYLKRVNLNTGLADFVKFERSQSPITNEKESTNINTYKDDIKALNDKLDGLYSLLAKNEEKGGKNAK